MFNGPTILITQCTAHRGVKLLRILWSKMSTKSKDMLCRKSCATLSLLATVLLPAGTTIHKLNFLHLFIWSRSHQRDGLVDQSDSFKWPIHQSGCLLTGPVSQSKSFLFLCRAQRLHPGGSSGRRRPTDVGFTSRDSPILTIFFILYTFSIVHMHKRWAL